MKKKKASHLRVVRGAKKGPPSIELDLDDITSEGVREAFIVRFGPECAAWLVRRFHSQIKRYGCFAMHLKAGDEIPPWCDIALSFLKKRARKWSVVMRTQSGARDYRVVWLGGAKGPRDLPEAIRRI